MSKTIRRYCLCGAALQARSTPPAAATFIAAAFDAIHIGPGHGPATRQQAAATRRREEAREDHYV